MTGLRESLDGTSQMSTFRSERQAESPRAQVICCGVVFGYSFVRGHRPIVPSTIASLSLKQGLASTREFTRSNTTTIIGRHERRNYLNGINAY
jgi:hypothetical protein